MFTLAGVRACRCGPFGSGLAVSLVNIPLSVFFFVGNSHPAIFTLEDFGGFSGSIVAPPLISAQQKERAIRVIIVAAACFLAVQRQLSLHPGSLGGGIGEGRS